MTDISETSSWQGAPPPPPAESPAGTAVPATNRDAVLLEESLLAEETDLAPLLPRGKPLFENIPSQAVVLEALAPAIGHGVMLVRRPDMVGVVLVREGGLFETYAFSGATHQLGDSALQNIRGWADATVSAFQLEPEVVDVAPSLLRGDVLYNDLRLSWIDWQQFLKDLSSRDGRYVVELHTPRGRGVTCFDGGRRIATFTESHPELGDAALLDALADVGAGTVNVRREPMPFIAATPVVETPAVAAASQPAPAPAEPASPAAEPMIGLGKPAAAEPALGQPVASPWDQPPAAPLEQPVSNPFEQQQPAPAPAPFSAPGEAASLASIFGPPTGGGAPAPAPAPSSSPLLPDLGGGGNGGSQGTAAPAVSINDILPDLKLIARSRLQRSAGRVEGMLDDAAAQSRPLPDVLAEIRALTIRGVMQSTLDDMVDEMSSTAAGRTA